MFLFPFPVFSHFWDSVYFWECREIKAKRKNQLCSYHYQRHHNYKKEPINLFPFFPQIRESGYSRDLILIFRKSLEFKAKRENRQCCCNNAKTIKSHKMFFCKLSKRRESIQVCRCLISLHRPGFLMNLQGLFHLEIIYQYSKVQFIPDIFMHFD